MIKTKSNFIHMAYTIKILKATKKFDNTAVFKNLNDSFTTGDIVAISGQNGSGKSTLIKIISGLLSLSRGRIEYYKDETLLEKDQWIKHIGMMAIDIFPYYQLTGMENLQFILNNYSNHHMERLITLFSMDRAIHKKVKYYSTGMKRKLQLISTLVKNPPILFFDEPGSNLDDKGKDIFYEYITDNINDKILLIATNAKEEKKLCQREISLD